ncbi:MAG TPA: tRNA preQ1(34) S-adenosylmethionine ribosyltransferase-isomerase QueA [Vicinamibacteria bacterium]|nr:tRNA preQ1(34) S-adenosylmethionine ribosyltransferase-isomerase QueA [Vicinamibacteria bacterium]
MTRRLPLSDFDYSLPRELIAQEPLEKRDRSRLLYLGSSGDIEHRRFSDLPALLSPGDLLVLNETKVFPARLFGRRATGGAVELLLLESVCERTWRALARPARKVGAGDRLTFAGGRLRGEVVETEPEGRTIVRFHYQGDWDGLLDAIGKTPIPPYIDRRTDERLLRERYQTLFARNRGSVAAPTAGLHFTDEVFAELRNRRIRTARLTLHVGYATFAPIRGSRLEEHRMGVERFFIPEETFRLVETTRRSGGRIVAVGTTTVRALESATSAGWDETDLFIAPGYPFRVVDRLVTNLHLPKSSLLVLVSAFAGIENVRRAYGEAVRERYRFYSFGDAMFLDRA